MKAQTSGFLTYKTPKESFGQDLEAFHTSRVKMQPSILVRVGKNLLFHIYIQQQKNVSQNEYIWPGLAPLLLKSAARNTMPFHLDEMPKYLASINICLFSVYVHSCH